MLGGIGASVLLGRMFPDVMEAVLEGVRTSRVSTLLNTLIRLAIGWILAWLYAAARFRLRSTLRTAIRIGLAVWFLVYVPYAWIQGSLQIFPWRMMGVLLVWGLFECLIAALLAGLVHRRLKPEYARY